LQHTLGQSSPHSSQASKIIFKKALRMVCGANYNAHTDPLFEKIDSQKFDDLVNFNLVKLGSTG
jgi:hypothetical protein